MAKKDVEINTRAFELKLHVNTKTLSTQVAIFIGLGLLWFFAGNGAVRVMCTIFLVLDLLVAFILLFDKKDTTDVDKETKEISHEEPATVDSKLVRKNPVKESSGVINNKVPIPNPTPVKEETKEDTIPSVEVAQSAQVNVQTEESEVDWGDVFGEL